MDTPQSDTSAERASARRALGAQKRLSLEWVVFPLAIIVVLVVVFGLRAVVG